MIRFLLCLFSTSLLLSAPAFSAVKRTDGPPGSEYGDPHILEGELQIGLHFGALLSNRSSHNSSFSIGGDVDWRPYDLFGFRISGYQGLQKPRSTLISLTPLAHTDFSNLRPYVLFGPGLGLFDIDGDYKAKFLITAGLGADVMLTERIGLGVEYGYHSVFDLKDYHLVGARVLISFPPSW